MIINEVSREIRSIINQADYRQVEIPIKETEIPIGVMNDEEKAIYSLLSRSIEMSFNNKNQLNNIKFLTKRLVNSLKRFGEERHACRSGFIVVTELNLSRLIWRPYSPALN